MPYFPPIAYRISERRSQKLHSLPAATVPTYLSKSLGLRVNRAVCASITTSATCSTLVQGRLSADTQQKVVYPKLTNYRTEMRRVKRVLADNEYSQVLHTDSGPNPFDAQGHHVGVNPLFVPTLPMAGSNSYGEFVLRPAPQHPFYLMVPEGFAAHKHQQYGNGGGAHGRRHHRSHHHHHHRGGHGEPDRSVSGLRYLFFFK